jgi:phage gpG-like protein
VIFGIQVLGVDEVSRKLKDLPAKLDRAEQRATNVLAVKAQSSWKRKATGDLLKVRTGAYRAAINAAPAVKVAPGGYEAVVGSRQGPASKYAPVHEYGATIRPKNKPYLVFKTADGKWVSVKQVVIPARRLMGKTLDEIRPLAPATLEAEVKKAIG